MTDKLTAGMIRASDHPDPAVREAENFGTALFKMLEDARAGGITYETLGHSYQKFCVERIRLLTKRARMQGMEEAKARINWMIERREKLPKTFQNEAELIGLGQGWGLVHELRDKVASERDPE